MSNFKINFINHACFKIQVNNYLEKAKTTIGLRSQDGFSRDLALYLASCNANHRDLSLSF